MLSVPARWLMPVLLFAFVLGGWAWYLVDSGPLMRRLHEGGPVETAGALLLLATSLCLTLAVVLSRARRASRWRHAAYLALALVFLLASAEEVSWGQHLFEWDTPSHFAGNLQGETNIHNFEAFDACHNGEDCRGWILMRTSSGGFAVDLANLFVAFMLGLSLGVPGAHARLPRVRRFLEAHRIAVPPLWAGIVLLLALLLSVVGVRRYTPEPTDNWAVRELLELQIEVVLFVVAAGALAQVLREPVYRARATADRQAQPRPRQAMSHRDPRTAATVGSEAPTTVTPGFGQ